MSVLTHNHYKEFWAEKSLLASLAVVAEWRSLFSRLGAA